MYLGLNVDHFVLDGVHFTLEVLTVTPLVTFGFTGATYR